MDNTVKTQKIKKPKRDKYGADYEYSPARQYVNTSTLAGGLIIRGIVDFFLNLGLLLFLNDCFAFGVNNFLLVLFALALTLSFSLIFIGKKFTFFGILASAATIGVWVIANIPLLPYAVSCFECFLNSMGNVFVLHGYNNLAFLQRAYEQVASPGVMNAFVMFIISAFFAIIFTLCTIRKTVIIPTVLVMLACTLPGITYNFVNSNWGFAFIILSMFALLTMKMFDHYFKAKKEDRLRRASLGGYAGGTVALIALICISVPAIFSRSTWKDIPFISKPISIARDVVTSVISGDMPNLKEMGIIKGMDEQNSRNVAPKNIYFTGKSMLTVERNYMHSSPTYLRGWVAADFDGYSWYSVTNDKIEEFNELFGELAKSAGYENQYSPDFMTEEFYKNLGSQFTAPNTESGAGDYIEYGYLAYRTDVKIELGAGTGNLLYLPSYSKIHDAGLSALGTTEAYKGVVKPFYDGMIITNWFNLDKSYSVDTFSPILSKKGAANKLMQLIDYANITKEFVRIQYENNMADSPELQEIYAGLMSDSNVPDELLNFDFYEQYMALSYEEKTQFYKRNVELCDKYTEYVNKNYGYDARLQSNPIINIVSGLGINPDDTQHEKVMKAVQFIAKNYKYTTTPKEGVINSYTPYEKFLVETKEGYCTQFATTLVLLLREMGIPARYVEGFIAKDFFNVGENKYSSAVSDRNAHAWVEVYYPSFGWLTYEATSRYAKAYYGTNIHIDSDSDGNEPFVPDPDRPDNPNVPLVPDDTVIPDDTITPTEHKINWLKIFRNILIITIIIAGGYYLFKFVKERADQAVYERRRLLEDAAYGVDADEYRDVSHKVNTSLLHMMYLAGYCPNVGELPMQFAKRVDENCAYATDKSFEPVMSKIQKLEFSTEISNPDLREIAEYTTDFWQDLYRHLSKPKKFWYRYVRRFL